MNYKKIFKNQKTRFAILNMLKWVPDKTMVKIQYKMKLGRKLNLKKPQRFTEKLQWYKLYYRNPIMHKCVDKYEVRDYIKSKGLDSILNELYGVFSNVEEIDFTNLPNKFVIKTTAGGGGQNILVVDDKNKINIDKTKEKLKEWLTIKNDKSFGREWSYEGITNRIIIEKLLEGNDEGLSGINDYKFFCYNGKVEYIVFDGDRYIKHKRSFYDKNWNYIDIQSDCDKMENIIKKPKKIDQMKKIAETISKDFPFVRVDLYSIKGNIYFGEMTFYPWTGYVQFEPDSFDYELGDKFELRRFL